MVVFGLGKNLLFKSILGRCGLSWKRSTDTHYAVYHNARKGAATTSQNFTVVEFDALQLSNKGKAKLHVPPYTIGIHFGICNINQMVSEYDN